MLGSSDSWMDDLLGGAPPKETKSDCSHCVMCGTGEPAAEFFYFDPKVRCCTYEPALPNFIVGRILRDDDPAFAAGRETVVQRLARWVDTTPWGIVRSKRFGALYKSSPNLFGRAADLACPHLQPGDLGCGIWRHRPGVCSTWHCKHDRGKVGFQFWTSLASLLREAELMLGAWCVAELHGGQAAMAHALESEDGATGAADLGGPLDKTRHTALWGAWVGRESDFYIQSAGLVDQLRWTDVERICGVRLRTLAALTAKAHAAVTNTELPERAKVGPFRILSASPGKRTVETYSGFNPVQMPEALFRLLPYFDGRRTEEILEEIRVKENVRVQPELVRRLADFGILSDSASH